MTGMPPAPWRTGVPASYKGAQFKVEVRSQAGGRRNVTHEFPERDVPYTEDRGRRARRWQITGYIVCGPTLPDYRPGRDTLISMLESGGAGTLVHPTYGSVQANLDTYSVSETRERGGMATFEMQFSEAGDINGAVTAATVNTQAAAQTQAANLMNVSASMLDRATQGSLSDTGGVVSA